MGFGRLAAKSFVARNAARQEAKRLYDRGGQEPRLGRLNLNNSTTSENMATQNPGVDISWVKESLALIKARRANGYRSKGYDIEVPFSGAAVRRRIERGRQLRLQAACALLR